MNWFFRFIISLGVYLLLIWLAHVLFGIDPTFGELLAITVAASVSCGIDEGLR
jgi:hypothetical protein